MQTMPAQKMIMDNTQMNKLMKYIRKAIHDEFVLLRLQLLPYVGDEEQADIEKRYGSTKNLKKGELIDVTDRVAHLRKR